MNGRCDVKMKLFISLCYGILRVGGCFVQAVKTTHLYNCSSRELLNPKPYEEDVGLSGFRGKGCRGEDFGLL